MGSDVRSAIFIDNSRMLTLSALGEVILWKLPSCLPLYSRQFAEKTRLTLAPNRKYYAITTPGVLKIVTVDSGEIVTALSYSDSGHIPMDQKSCFQINGERIAILDRSHSFSHLRVWNIKNSQLLSETKFPFPVWNVSWCGDDILLSGVSGNLMVDKNSNKAQRKSERPWIQNDIVESHRYAIRLSLDSLGAIWRYDTTGYKFVPDSPDGRSWFLSRERNKPSAILVAIGTRFPEESKIILREQNRNSLPHATTRSYLGHGVTRLTSSGLDFTPLKIRTKKKGVNEE